MKILILDDIHNITEAELEKDLMLLPEWRREAALKFKFLSGKVQCTKAYLLLRQALLEEYGIREDDRFGYGENGKPYLAGHPDIHFNLSHCKEAVMCAVDDHPIGCDIESIQRKTDLALLKRTMSPAEQERVFSSEDPGLEFMKLWTAKEAVIKQSGEGLSRELADLFENGLSENLELSTTAVPEKGYVRSVCHVRS
ncbi:MAG: 4'-phosphopantetheinyl transferase superfamily protein [Lachnospiraceae bacterium]|nr:4'-phosphopantetheinyl transferase superfamily protein [Lachnospiraceae bacterium]